MSRFILHITTHRGLSRVVMLGSNEAIKLCSLGILSQAVDNKHNITYNWQSCRWEQWRSCFSDHRASI